MRLFIVTVILAVTVHSSALADVIVQQKDCWRVWNSSDTITMTMSDRTFEKWKRENKQHIHKSDIRFVHVEKYERFNRVKEYDWIYWEDCEKK